MFPAKDRPIRIKLLGRVAIELPGGSVTAFRSAKVPALLGYLAVNPGLQSRERIADALWPEGDRDSARHNLRQTLLYVRQLIEPAAPDALRTTRSDIELHSDVLPSDVSVLLSTEPPSEFEETRQRCERAVEAYSGPFLKGFDEDWITDARSRLALLYVRTLIFLADAYMETDPGRALEFARRAVAEEPLLDGARARKIKALVRSGETAAAQLEYESFADLLADELGMSPADIVVQALEDSPAKEKQPLLREDTGEVPSDVVNALESLAAGDRPQRAVELAIALTPHWIETGTPGFGFRALECAIERAGDRMSGSVKRHASYCVAHLAAARGDLNLAKSLVDRALAENGKLETDLRAKFTLLDAALDLTNVRGRQALEKGLESLEIAGPEADPTFLLEVYSYLTSAALCAGEFELGLKYVNQVLELGAELGESSMISRALLKKAQLLDGMGRSDEAEETARRAVAVIANQTGTRAAWVRLDCARLMEDLGHREEAEAGYRTAVYDYRKLDDEFSLVISLTYLGDLLTATGRPMAAIPLHEEAIAIRRRLNQTLGLATSLRGLGRALASIGDLSRAREALSESAHLFQNDDAQPGFASVVLILSEVEERAGNYSLAFRLSKRAAELLHGMTEWEQRSIGPSGISALEEAEARLGRLRRTGT